MKNIKELGLETIQLEDQVLLVNSKSGTSKGDLFIDKRTPNEIRNHVADSYENHFDDHWKHKIIASTKPLEGLPLLVIEDEVENVFYQDNILDKEVAQHFFSLFKEGYNKAKETFKFTEEDLRKAIQLGSDFCDIESFEPVPELVISDFLQSLTKKELYVEVEEKSIEEIEIELGIYGHDEGLTESEYSEYIKKNNVLKLKITNNQIKAVWK